MSETSNLTEVLYYDGRSAAAHAVRIEIGQSVVAIIGDHGTPLDEWPLSKVRPSGARRFALEGGDGRLVVDDPDLAAYLAQRAAKAGPGRLRKGAGILLLCVLILAGVGGAFALVAELMPRAASAIPIAWEVPLGDAIRDDAVGMFARFSGGSGRTCDGGAGRTVLADLSGRLAAAADAAEFPFQVTVVDVGMTNAVALPGGRILILKGLLDVAEGPDEIAAVLAHEMAHAIRRHPLRALLRSEGVKVLSALILPDGLAGTVGSGVGQMLLHLSYTREAESEADTIAFETLDRAGLRGDGMAALFQRLQEKAEPSQTPGFLTSHPPMADRIARSREHGAGAPALDEAGWDALRKICDRP